MTFTAYKIDVYTQTIYPVQLDHTLKSLYNAIGCRTIDFVARQDNGDALCVDDESLLTDPQPPCFSLEGYQSPICGNALLLGCDAEGNSCAPVMRIEVLRERVCFAGPLNIVPEIIVFSF